MSIKSELDRLSGSIAGAYSAVQEQGGALPVQRTSENLADAIRNIPISTGTDTSDATAAAGDIVQGKTAYNAAGKVTGAMPLRSGDVRLQSDVSWTGEGIQAESKIQTRETFESGSKAVMVVPKDCLGDAAPEDVCAGKMFTSAAGLKAVGKMVSNTVNLTVYTKGSVSGYRCFYTNAETGALETCQTVYATGAPTWKIPKGSIIVIIMDDSSYKDLEITNQNYSGEAWYFNYLVINGSRSSMIDNRTTSAKSDIQVNSITTSLGTKHRLAVFTVPCDVRIDMI